jgi:hypothetical protein
MEDEAISSVRHADGTHNRMNAVIRAAAIESRLSIGSRPSEKTEMTRVQAPSERLLPARSGPFVSAAFPAGGKATVSHPVGGSSPPLELVSEADAEYIERGVRFQTHRFTDLFAVDAGQLLDFIITKEFDGGISVHMKILGPLVDSASHDFRDFVHRNIRHSVLVIDR